MGLVERINILASEQVKLKDNAELRFGSGTSGADATSSDVYMVWDGTDLHMMSYADDAVFNIGDGTKSMDVRFYGNASTSYLEWDASNDRLHQSGGTCAVKNATFTQGTLVYAVPFQAGSTAGFIPDLLDALGGHVLDYAIKQRAEAAKELAVVSRKALMLRGAIAALDDVIEQARKGGSNDAAPIAPVEEMIGLKAIKVGNGPLQADQEYKE